MEVLNVQTGSKLWHKSSAALQQQYFALLDVKPDTRNFRFSSWHFGNDTLLAYTWTYDSHEDGIHDECFTFGEAPHGFVNVVKLDAQTGKVMTGRALHVPSVEGYAEVRGIYVLEDPTKAVFSPEGHFLVVPVQMFQRCYPPEGLSDEELEGYDDEMDSEVLLVVDVTEMTLKHVIKSTAYRSKSLGFVLWSCNGSTILFSDQLVHMQDGCSFPLSQAGHKGDLSYDTKGFDKTGNFVGFTAKYWPKDNSGWHHHSNHHQHHKLCGRLLHY